MSNFKKEIYLERFRQVIANSNMTGKELACKLGISQKTLSAYVKGEAFPRTGTAQKICKFFDISSDYLLGLKD